MFKTVKLAKGKKENQVINFKGESVEMMNIKGNSYFENRHNTEGFSASVTDQAFAALGAIFHAATKDDIVLSGYSPNDRSTPRGTVRGNENLQNSIEQWAIASRIPFDYITDLLKSSVAGLEGAAPAFDAVALRKQAKAEYEAACANELASKVTQLESMGLPADIVKVNAPVLAQSAIDALKREYEAELKRINHREKQSESLKAKNGPKAETPETVTTEPAMA